MLVEESHSHPTNSLNTPLEALESAYPLRVRRYAIRRNSGGAGQQRGGDGVICEIELLTDAQVTLLSDGRKIAPYGLAGGEAGQVGEAELISGGRSKGLRGKLSIKAKAGDRIVIKTPGGGGWAIF